MGDIIKTGVVHNITFVNKHRVEVTVEDFPNYVIIASVREAKSLKRGERISYEVGDKKACWLLEKLTKK